MLQAIMVAMVLWTATPTDCDERLMAAIEYTESRGNPWAESHTGAIGLMQVQPEWSPWPRLALYLPAVNRAEGCRVYRRWTRRAADRCTWERSKGKRGCKVKERALAAYNAGVHGLRGRSPDGRAYALAVLGRVRW